MNHTATTPTAIEPDKTALNPPPQLQDSGARPAPFPDRAKIAGLRFRFEQELFENVIPFWEKHSPDPENGGYFNCLDRDGYVYDTTKHVWLQARQVFMFSKLSNSGRPGWKWRAMASAFCAATRAGSMAGSSFR